MFVYQWTNKINGKKYIGRHGGEMSSTYKGSGKYFRRALKKYGEENFERVILVECDTIDDCKKWEQYFLDLYDAAHNDEFYNISPNSDGGHHGADYIGEKNPMWGKKHPNHIPHYGNTNGMYGVKRYLSENPNAKKIKLIDPNKKEHVYNSIKEACIDLFGSDENYGKMKHLVKRTKEGKKMRENSTFYRWEAYYV